MKIWIWLYILRILKVQRVINEENNLPDQVRSGNEDMFLSPFSFYLTKDLKYIAIAVGSHAHFSRLCEAIDKPVWLSLYPDNKDRLVVVSILFVRRCILLMLRLFL